MPPCFLHWSRRLTDLLVGQCDVREVFEVLAVDMVGATEATLISHVVQRGRDWRVMATTGGAGSDHKFANQPPASTASILADLERIQDVAEDPSHRGGQSTAPKNISSPPRSNESTADSDSAPRDLIRDEDSIQTAPGLLAISLRARQPQWLLVRHGGDRVPHDDVAVGSRLLAGALEQSQLNDFQRGRASALEQIVTASAQWYALDSLDELLTAVAGTATEVLRCARASIFLRDSRRKRLIGRPALGLPGNQLVVSENRGVVGEVVSNGIPQLWTRDDDSDARQNADIDQRNNFVTVSLAAVPIWSAGGLNADGQPLAGGRVTGVFEAINHHDGSFDDSDLDTLAILARHVAAALATQKQRKDLRTSRDHLIDQASQSNRLLGSHPTIETLRTQIERVAPTDLSVLIRGENGTGKEVLARQIHYSSTRRDRPFIAVNCAALVESLLESELFGHEAGSFTDAQKTRIGKFESVAGGTLFLDEIGDMSAGGQAKLLRALENREIVRVGGTETIPIDVRIIAATNQPLEQRIAEKLFREDLFFRLAVVSLTVPPLRSRGEDILELAEKFIEQYASAAGRPRLQLSGRARQQLRRYSWPGNVRQLRNVIERVCYLASDNLIEPSDLDLPKLGVAAASEGALATELSEATKQFQITHINSLVQQNNGNMTRAAEALGLHRSNLYRKMRQLGMGEEESTFSTDS